MGDIENQVVEAIAKIESTCTLLYQNNLKDGNAQIVETISSIINVVESISANDKKFSSDYFDLISLNSFLIKAQEAFEKRDYVLYADILYYDVKNILELPKIMLK